MPKNQVFGFLLLASAMVTQPGRAADLAQVGPQASAAQIVAASGRGAQTILRLTFTVSGGRQNNPESMSADLAPDYLLVRTGGRATIYDYKLRRTLVLDEAARNFSNDSLYGLADFRVAEKYNRRMLRGVLAKLGKLDAVDDAFWEESELHVVDPREPSPLAQRQSMPDGKIRFDYKNSEVASFTVSDQTLMPGEAAGLRHLLTEQTTLHPAIIAALAESGHVPKRLSFVLPLSRQKGTEIWVLQSASRQTAAYPLTANYAALPLAQRKDLSALADVLPVMLEAGRANKASHSLAQYQAAIADALSKKASFQAALLAFEASEQYGESALDCSGGQAGCHSLKEIFTEAQKDARANAMLHALGTEKADRAKAITEMQGVRHDNVTNGYVVDDFAGNMLGGAGRQKEAVPLIANAVRGDPYVAGYYKDMGDVFRMAFNPSPAWICYDLGRVLPGGPAAPVIDEINKYETQLARDFPQFF